MIAARNRRLMAEPVMIEPAIRFDAEARCSSPHVSWSSAAALAAGSRAAAPVAAALPPSIAR